MPEAPSPTDPETLLAHGDFVRSLARSLLFDEHRVDDVVQQTWLAALERPPRRASALRSWLAVVARNFARQIERGERRRSRREEEAARPESLPSTEEIVAREAARRRVVEAVLALEEPYRSAVLLRFYEDFPPREIARRCGVPVETAKTRLKRALERLRERLDREADGDRRAWCLALLPLALPKPAQVALGGLVAKAVAGSAAAGLLVAGALVALRAITPEAPEGLGPATVVAAEPMPAPPIPSEPEGPSHAGAPTAAEASPFRTPLEPPSRAPRVRGRVAMRDGSAPPTDAFVRIRTRAGRTKLGAGADREGAFSIEVPSDLPLFRLEVDADFAAYGEEEWFALSSPEVVSGVVLVLEPAGTIEGTIRDAEGKLLREGEVRIARSPETGPARTWTARGDAEGRYAFRGVLPGVYAAAAKAEGGAPARREGLEVKPRARTAVDFSLGVESSVSGLVVDPEGKGVAGAEVEAKRMLGFATDPLVLEGNGTADERGAFRLGSLGAGTHLLTARMRGLYEKDRPPTVVLPEGGGVVGARITLARGESVEGRVVDAHGRAVANALVTAGTDLSDLARTRWIGMPRSVSVRTAEDGSFRLEGLGDHEFVVTASARDQGRVEVRGVRPDGNALLLALPRIAGVAGSVLEETRDAPVDRFSVRCDRVRRRGSTVLFRHVGSSLPFAGTGGTFEVLGLEPDTYDLVLDAGGFARAILEGVEVQAGEVRRDIVLRLRVAGAIRGLVVAKGSGEPVPEALVRRLGSDPSARIPSPDRARTRFDGTFELARLEPGALRLRVSHPDFLEATTGEIEVRARETIEGLEISLDRGGGIEGEARYGDGSPVAFGRVEARPIEPSGGDAKKTATDGGGAFRMTGLHPGRYRAGVHAEAETGFSPALEPSVAEAEVLVESGKVARVTLPAASKGCTIRGRVLRRGEPVSGARVSLARAAEIATGAFRTLSAETGPDGSFRIERVLPGEAFLRVDASADRSTIGGDASLLVAGSVHEISVPEAPELVRDLDLPGGEIAGRVTRAADGSPVEGFPVIAVPSEPRPGLAFLGETGYAVTGRDGRYRIRDLRPGPHRVTAGSRAPAAGEEDLASVTRGPVVAAEEAPAVVDFEMGKAGTLLVEVSDRANLPVRGRTLVLRRADEKDEAVLRGTERYASTDERGVARFERLAAGRFVASIAGRTTAMGDPVDGLVEEGKETRLRLVLVRATRVSLRVLGEKDEPAAVSSVRFVEGENREAAYFPSLHGTEEATVVAHLAPGDYEVAIAFAAGRREDTRVVHIEDEPRQDLVIRVPAEAGGG